MGNECANAQELAAALELFISVPFSAEWCSRCHMHIEGHAAWGDGEPYHPECYEFLQKRKAAVEKV